jgi:transcriptional regulator with XRE-family HTH domain
MSPPSRSAARDLTEPPTASHIPIGVELRRLRRCRGLSQKEMARLLGLSAHSAVADYESGKRIPAGDIITGYERAFGILDGRLQRLRAQGLADAANAEYRAVAAGFGHA